MVLSAMLMQAGMHAPRAARELLYHSARWCRLGCPTRRSSPSDVPTVKGAYSSLRKESLCRVVHKAKFAAVEFYPDLCNGY